VGLIDLAPTILELAGASMARPPAGMSLAPWLFLPPGDPVPARGPVFAEMVEDAKHSSRKVMIDWPWKLHRSVTYAYDELFHLGRDPGESENRAKADPEVYDRLRGRLARWMAEELQSVKAGRLATSGAPQAP
jgi:arylsulfatase A-like enzyme